MTTEIQEDSLVNAVSELTHETTELLTEYRDAKLSIDSKVNKAEESAKAATAKAGEAATSAQEAKAQADKATSKATEATAQAAKAKASADKASQITGLDTVTEAVQVALADSYQYAMTRAEFDANREMNKEKFAGSGFVEWGKHQASSSWHPVNEGLWCLGGTKNYEDVALLGTSSKPNGVSKTYQAVAVVDGVVFNISDNATNGAGKYSQINFPLTPNGTKTYDSATGEVIDYTKDIDPKYGDVAADTNEAVARAFEGMAKNGDFRLGSEDWSASSAITFTALDGVGTATATDSGSLSSAGILLSTGVNYITEFDVVVVGSVKFQYGNGNGGITTLTTGKQRILSNGNPLGGNSVSFVMAAGANAKISNVSIRPVTNKVITTRQDLVFLESWHEDTSEKGVLVPLGNVQYGATSWEGITLKKLTELGIGQGYSAFGEWDADTVGYGVRISDLTDVQLQKFQQDPKNNIYFDAETGKLVQVRYRIRVIEGLGDEWSNVGSGLMGNANLYINNNRPVQSQGANTTPIDTSIGANIAYTYRSTNNKLSSHASDAGIGFTYWSSPSGTLGQCFALPIALVQRLNQGAYHPVFNPSGCAKQLHDSVWKYWYADSSLLVSTAACFLYKAPCGNISSKVSGRPTNYPYQYYDAIYAGQVQDLRLSAHKQDVNKLRVDAMRKAVSGEMRGVGKVPFTHVYTDADNRNITGCEWVYLPLDVNNKDYVDGFVYLETNNGYVKRKVDANTANRFKVKGYDKIPNGKIVAVKWLTPQYDILPWTDLIGSPSAIAATFPNGVQGMWIPQIPTGASKVYELNRKVKGTDGTRIVTTDNGVTFISYNTLGSFNAVTNATTEAFNVNHVWLIQYPTLSNFTQPADNSKVVGEVGDVWSGMSSFVKYGNRTISSLVSKVATHRYGISSTNPVSDVGLIEHPNGAIYKSIEGVSHSKGMRSTGMWHYTEVDETNAAVKALSTITEKDGLLYLQLHGSELHYDNTAGNWGDNSTIPIVDGESTRTDDNGHTVKTFCHHGMIPLGIASYSDSSQAKDD